MNVIPQRVKDGFVGLTSPMARALIRSGVHPNTITTLGTLLVIGRASRSATVGSGSLAGSCC